MAQTQGGTIAGYDVVTAASDGTVRCFDSRTRLEVARVAPHTETSPSCVAASGSSLLVAVGTSDGILRLYQRHLEDTPLLRFGWRGRVSKSTLTQLAFSSDGKHLAACSQDGLVLILRFDAASAEPHIASHFTLPLAPTSISWTAAAKLLGARPSVHHALHVPLARAASCPC